MLSHYSMKQLWLFFNNTITYTTVFGKKIIVIIAVLKFKMPNGAVTLDFQIAKCICSTACMGSNQITLWQKSIFFTYNGFRHISTGIFVLFISKLCWTILTALYYWSHVILLYEFTGHQTWILKCSKMLTFCKKPVFMSDALAWISMERGALKG